MWFRSYLNGLVVFPTFFNLNLNFALRSLWSEPQSAPGLFFFCWLYRASPSLTAKSIISLISVLTIWWCPCVKSSLVLLEEGVCYDQCILLTKLYEPLPCFLPSSKAKYACYSRCFLTSYFCSPIWWKEHLFLVLVLEDLVGLHRTVQPQLFGISCWGIDLDCCDIEWFALETNWVWPWSTKWSREKAIRVLPREYTGHSKHSRPTTQEMSLHMDITR